MKKTNEQITVIKTLQKHSIFNQIPTVNEIPTKRYQRNEYLVEKSGKRNIEKIQD